ncbi:uncharacterized protein LOC111133843 isoform X3 [Crassostrea virginica]
MSGPAEHSERIDDLPDECVQDDLQVEADITLVVPTEGPTSVLVGRIEELEEQVQLITLDRDAATRRLQRARGAVCQLQAELLVHNGIIRQLEAQWQAVVTGFQRPVPPRENRGTVDEGDIASVAEGPGDPEAFYRTRSGRRSKPPPQFHLIICCTVMRVQSESPYLLLTGITFYFSARTFNN